MSFSRSSSTAVRTDKSSLESGNASIIARPPRRNPSLGLDRCANSPNWSDATLSPIDQSEIIDLQPEQLPKIPRASTDESLTAVLAAAIQMSSVPLKQRSSLSSGRASVILPSARFQQDASRRDSNSSISSDESASPKTPTSRQRLSSYFFSSGKKAANPVDSEQKDGGKPSEEDTFGMRDLLERGIHVKEISTTMKKMVVPDNILNPMPSVMVERPRFAR